MTEISPDIEPAEPPHIDGQPVARTADPLGDRMKNYERQARLFLPARAHTITRIDGRAFHTWTR